LSYDFCEETVTFGWWRNGRMDVQLLGPNFNRGIIWMSENIIVPIGIAGGTTICCNKDVRVAIFDIAQWSGTWLIGPGTVCVKQEKFWAWKISHLASMCVKLVNDLLIERLG
jgi:hypothetical protein